MLSRPPVLPAGAAEGAAVGAPAEEEEPVFRTFHVGTRGLPPITLSFRNQGGASMTSQGHCDHENG